MAFVTPSGAGPDASDAGMGLQEGLMGWKGAGRSSPRPAPPRPAPPPPGPRPARVCALHPRTAVAGVVLDPKVVVRAAGVVARREDDRTWATLRSAREVSDSRPAHRATMTAR